MLMFYKHYIIQKKLQPIIMCTNLKKKNFTPTYLSKNWKFIPKIDFLKYFIRKQCYSHSLHTKEIFRWAFYI